MPVCGYSPLPRLGRGFNLVTGDALGVARAVLLPLWGCASRVWVWLPLCLGLTCVYERSEARAGKLV